MFTSTLFSDPAWPAMNYPQVLVFTGRARSAASSTGNRSRGIPHYPYKETYVGIVPDGMVVGENGKLWMQEKMVGETACLGLQGEKPLQHGGSISLSSARCIADSCSRIPDSL